MTQPESRWQRYRREKREWRQHVRRVKALPGNYRTAMKQLEKFMWNFALDGQMTAALDGIVDLFEEGAAAGRTVLEVTGDDVADFALSVMAESRAATWTGKKASQLNAQIRRSLDRPRPADGR
jgi:DNA-binding ferritin-like protein (Dps family)